VSSLAHNLTQWPLHAAGRVAGAISTYFTEEQASLLKRLDHEYFTAAVTRLRDDVARLEQRVERLASARVGG
jgi:ubiquinone biosynthesis protein UbiJ